LHNTSRREPPAVYKCRCTGIVPDGVNGYINDRPHTLGVLLAEAEEIDLTDRN
jgi:hypothetical protein